MSKRINREYSFAPNLSKMEFEVGIRKSNSGFGISFSKMPGVPIFRMDNFDFFDPNLLKVGFGLGISKI